MFGKDTIAAISTPLGPGGIGIVRLSGPGALQIAGSLVGSGLDHLNNRSSHTTGLAKIVDPATGALIDEALITVMKAPRSYTREDVVEINCHSGQPTLRAVLRLALAAGARLAEPGEFTKRAFLSGRIDLTQAQAVISLIQAQSDAAARAAASQADGHIAALIAAERRQLLGLVAELEAAVDFTDEDIEPLEAAEVCRGLEAVRAQIEILIGRVERGRVLDQGLVTAIVGRPNVGKSSLLNALAMEDKAIVSALPGTTRDIVESRIVLGDIPLLIMDTAGWRTPGDDVEAQGIGKTRKSLERADLVLLVFDGSAPLGPEDHELIEEIVAGKPLIAIINKSDLGPGLRAEDLPEKVRLNPVIGVSAKTGQGLDALAVQVGERIGLAPDPEGGEAIMVSAQQAQALTRAGGLLAEALAAHTGRFSEEIVSMLAKEAIAALGAFCGEDIDAEVLKEIFGRFCIGK